MRLGMTQITLATFNCENLMMRCDFSSVQIPDFARKLRDVSDPAEADKVDAVFDVLSEDDRTLTALALSTTNADICALQEVENLVTLTAFHNRYLRRWVRRPYAWRRLYEGNDGRGIDVAALSRLSILNARSHADLTYAGIGVNPPPGAAPDARAFRRDCLEMEVEKEGRCLVLFICHFKSMHGGREETRPVRMAEAQAVRKLIEQRFADPESADWVILGDFNDYLEIDGDKVSDHGLHAFVGDGFAVDALTMLEPDPLKRWTHYYNGGDAYSALDHIFMSPALAQRNQDATIRVLRAGMARRVERVTARRFPGVGWVNPKSSDHCPMALRLTL